MSQYIKLLKLYYLFYAFIADIHIKNSFGLKVLPAAAFITKSINSSTAFLTNININILG